MRTEERQARQAIERYERKKEELFRRDGAKKYGEAEHAERLAELISALQGEIEHLIEGAEKAARRHEEEASREHYADPSKGLTSTESARLSALRPMVAEDCELLPLGELTRRLNALASASETEVGVARMLHTRYAGFRARALADKLDAAARGEAEMAKEAVSRQSAELRELREAVGALEERLADPTVAERRERASEAARRSEEFAGRLRGLLAEADGTEAAVQEAGQDRLRAVL